MSQKEFKYDAFISYRHAELDSFVAETLHKQLENFKVPKIADKEIKQTGKKGIKRVFRDKEELPLVGNLSAPITEALKESEFLIVICSPRTKESLWVQREIETFLEYRDASHILAVLIEGEPSEAFPSQICKLKRKVVSSEGTITYEEVDVEPLAADVRGSSKKEIKAKLKKEMLRMAAPMLGCEYDDLKQRHRERKIKRLLVTFATIGIVCLLFGAFSTYQALRIQKQSQKIKEQTEELKVLQSKSLSNTALDLYENGDKIGGLLVALAGLPEDLDNPERPIVAESTAALAEILQIYENETNYCPYQMLAHDTITETSVLNEDGTILVSLDQLGQLYSWDTDTGKMLAKTEDNIGISIEDNIAFIDKTTILCVGENGIASMDVTDFTVKWSVSDFSASALVLSKDRTMAAVAKSGNVTVYNTQNGEIISSYTDEKYGNIGKCMSFSPDGTYLAASLTSFFEEGQGKVVLLKTDSGEAIQTYTTSFLSIEGICIANEGECYIISYDSSNLGEFGMTMNQNLSCFNQDGTVRFQIEGMMGISSPIKIMGDYIVYPNGGSICIVSRKDGEIFQEITYNTTVRNYEILEESSAIIAGLADGSVVVCLIKNEDVLSQQYLEPDEDRMRHVYHYANKVIKEPLFSNKIFVYKNVLGSKAEEVYQSENSIELVKNSSDNKKNFIYTSKMVIASLTDEKKELYCLKPENTVLEIVLMEEEDEILLIEYDKVEVFRLSNGERIGSLEVDGNTYFYKNKKIYTRNLENNLAVYDMKNLSLIAEYELDLYKKAYPSEDDTIIVGCDLNGDGFYYDTTTSEKTPLEWNGQILVSDKQGKRYLIADSHTNKVYIYQFGEKKPEAFLDMKVDFINKVGFSPDGEKLFISLKDDSIKIYRTSDFSLYTTFENAPQISQWENVPSSDMELLYDSDNFYMGYLLSNKMELLYKIPNFKAISGDGKRIYTSSDRRLLSFPVYNLQMLVEEAKEVLDGRELTEEEKRLYYVN